MFCLNEDAIDFFIDYDSWVLVDAITESSIASRHLMKWMHVFVCFYAIKFEQIIVHSSSIPDLRSWWNHCGVMAANYCHSWGRWWSDTLWQRYDCAHSGNIGFFLGQNWHYSYLQSVILWTYCCQSWARADAYLLQETSTVHCIGFSTSFSVTMEYWKVVLSNYLHSEETLWLMNLKSDAA
jgi:hypothetical protein